MPNSEALADFPTRPYREVRARFDDTTVRVYQAFKPSIARAAVDAQTFKPPFKRDRMTWVKPSFTWMMYRCGYGAKVDQERVLAIDITREGFEWALRHSTLSHFDAHAHASAAAWKASLVHSTVRVQWDPERTPWLDELPWRTLQMGLTAGALDANVDTWIRRIEDVTEVAHAFEAAAAKRDLALTRALVPDEVPYPLPADIARTLGVTTAT